MYVYVCIVKGTWSYSNVQKNKHAFKHQLSSTRDLYMPAASLSKLLECVTCIFFYHMFGYEQRHNWPP